MENKEKIILEILEKIRTSNLLAYQKEDFINFILDYYKGTTLQASDKNKKSLLKEGEMWICNDCGSIFKDAYKDRENADLVCPNCMSGDISVIKSDKYLEEERGGIVFKK